MSGPISIKTDYSLLESLIKVKDLVNYALKNNLNSLGICDNNLSYVMEFYNLCQDNNIKPIIGLEITYHENKVYLYAQNYLGYLNLIKLNTIKEIDELLLTKYSNNIICILPFKSNKLFNELKMFDNIFLGYDNLKDKVSSLLITNNIIYFPIIKCFRKEEKEYFNYLNLMGGNNILTNKYYFDELEAFDEETLNTFNNLISELVFPIKRYIPKVKKDLDSNKYLTTLALKGLEKRLNNNVNDIYLNRLNYELDVITKMGYVDYFLIVYDYVLYAKKNNILVGPGRGSAAGSLVCYSIGITDIDPIKYNLMFERFLNPSRITLPDIDIDFDSTKRDIMIDYVKDKYGFDNVALGLTFNTLKSKLILREICKILKINDTLTNKFIKEINHFLSLNDNLKNIRVQKYLSTYPELKQVYDISLHLEGLKKNISTHAAGVVISSVPLDEIIPIIKTEDTLLTGLTMDYLENLGILKMDFLGLHNLTIIANILEKTDHNLLKNIDLEDSLVYKLFCEGNTKGIFQFETIAMQSLVTKLKPTCFNDLVASLALVRPGAIDSLDTYIENKNNPNNIVYIDESLKPILKETYGVILYQEQIIAILELMGGLTKSEADLIRRGISKKKEDLIKTSEKKFLDGALKKGYSKELSIKVYNLILKFASYGFNKSHSVAYALIAYQMAYLKCHYQEYFINELLKDNKDAKEIEVYLNELKQKDIIINKPDINNLNEDYDIIDNKLYLPLYLIKGINRNIAHEIYLNKPYEDYYSFVTKNNTILDNKIITTLIDADAMRSLKLNHHTLITNIDALLNYASLGTFSDDLKPILTMEQEYTEDELRSKELDLYGFYVGMHPSSKYQDKSLMKIKNINNYLFKNIICIVTIDNIKNVKTKKGEDMAFLSISDETGKIDATIFPRQYGIIDKINKNDLVLIKGSVSKSYDKTRIIVNEIKKQGRK
jgi:DNA polymerase-3 subunit alpha